jgi:hypothetical protein
MNEIFCVPKRWNAKSTTRMAQVMPTYTLQTRCTVHPPAGPEAG